MNLSHNEKNEHLANMPDARLQNKGNHHATFRTRSSKPVRLPLKSQRSPCGDFAEDSFIRPAPRQARRWLHLLIASNELR